MRFRADFLKRQWISSVRKKGTLVAKTLSFKGKTDDLSSFTCEHWGIIEDFVTIWLSADAGSDPKLTLGKRVFIGQNTYLGVYQPIQIGDNTIIGAYSYLISANHRYESRETPVRDQGFVGAPICIEEDVWIGTHVVILPGVTICKGAIIAAGSIVNRSVPPYEIWGGAPAKFIKERPLE